MVVEKDGRVKETYGDSVRCRSYVYEAIPNREISFSCEIDENFELSHLTYDWILKEPSCTHRLEPYQYVTLSVLKRTRYVQSTCARCESL